jgi:hypothetical protein
MLGWLVGLNRKAIDMRALTLLETGYLCGLLLLSLVLPLLMSFRGPPDAAVRMSCMRIAWTGQALGALAAAVVLASARLAPYAAVVGLVSYIACVLPLLRQFRSVRSGQPHSTRR